MTNWNYYFICPCKLIIGIPKNDINKVKMKKCPVCGEERNNWKVRMLKWTSTSVWWNPFSWGRGYYIDIDKQGE